jgi:hypothetical protein
MGEDRTSVCCIMLRGFVIRGERLIKHGYSWFFAKFIEVKRFLLYVALEFTLKNIAMSSIC